MLSRAYLRRFSLSYFLLLFPSEVCEQRCDRTHHHTFFPPFYLSLSCCRFYRIYFIVFLCRRKLLFLNSFLSLLVGFQVNARAEFRVKLRLQVAHDRFDVCALGLDVFNVFLHFVLGLFQFLLFPRKKGYRLDHQRCDCSSHLGLFQIAMDKHLSNNKWNEGRFIFYQEQLVRGIFKILQISLLHTCTRECGLTNTFHSVAFGWMLVTCVISVTNSFHNKIGNSFIFPFYHPKKAHI